MNAEQKVINDSEFIYKKLDLFGQTNDFYRQKYFETISEEKFNTFVDKSQLKLESITV